MNEIISISCSNSHVYLKLCSGVCYVIWESGKVLSFPVAFAALAWDNIWCALVRNELKVHRECQVKYSRS